MCARAEPQFWWTSGVFGALIRNISTSALNPISSYRIVSCLILSLSILRILIGLSLNSLRAPEILSASEWLMVWTRSMQSRTHAVKHHVSVPTWIGSIIARAPPSTTLPHSYTPILLSYTPPLPHSSTAVCSLQACILGLPWQAFRQLVGISKMQMQ